MAESENSAGIWQLTSKAVGINEVIDLSEQLMGGIGGDIKSCSLRSMTSLMPTALEVSCQMPALFSLSAIAVESSRLSTPLRSSETILT
jgi:hypothetical protein